MFRCPAVGFFAHCDPKMQCLGASQLFLSCPLIHAHVLLVKIMSLVLLFSPLRYTLMVKNEYIEYIVL